MGEKLLLTDALSKAPVCHGLRSGSDDSDVVVAIAEEVST